MFSLFGSYSRVFDYGLPLVDFSREIFLKLVRTAANGFRPVIEKPCLDMTHGEDLGNLRV